MERRSIDFLIHEAGCLLYVADESLGGVPANEFHEFFGGRPGLKELTKGESVVATSLYQDDGYTVRVVFGELNSDESSQWTSRVRARLNISSGRMIVCGVCDDMLEDTISEFTAAENSSQYDLGAFVEMPSGRYDVTIYSYPPNDLAGGWMRLTNKGFFRQTFNADASINFETASDYFARTRPGESPRQWITEGWEDDDFLTFVIQLVPATEGELSLTFEDDGCTKWEYRKPDLCPTGIICSLEG